MKEKPTLADILAIKAERFVGNSKIVRSNGTSKTRFDRLDYAQDLADLAQFLTAAVRYIRENT